MKTSAAAAPKSGVMQLACILTIVLSGTILADERIVQYKPKAGPLLWPSEPPDDIPFEPSEELVGIFREEGPISKMPDTGTLTALIKTSNDLSQRALILINDDLQNYHEFYHPDLHRLFEHPAPIRDISIDYTLSGVAGNFHYNLRPGQVIILLQDRDS